MERIESYVTGMRFNQQQKEFLVSTSECEALQSPRDESLTCSVCKEDGDIWICLICHSQNCGRYKNKHAVEHFEKTHHLLSLHVESG